MWDDGAPMMKPCLKDGQSWLRDQTLVSEFTKRNGANGGRRRSGNGLALEESKISIGIDR
jgi:hypothetical protein